MKVSNITRIVASLAALCAAGALSASCSSEGDAGSKGGRGGSNAGGSGGSGAVGTGGGAATSGVGGSSAGSGSGGFSASGGASGSGGSSASGGAGGSGGSSASGGSDGFGGFSAAGGLPNDGGPIDADFWYDAPQVERDACAAETAQGEKVPLDIYVMYDQSTSMTCPAGATSRWGVVTPAFQQFLSSPQAAGIGVGIQYFGQGGDCNAALYFNPDVPIAPLPGNLPALTSSLQAHGNIGINLTTTNAALIGAIDQAKAWKNSHQSHVVAVLLVTDGQPNACGTVQNVVTTAANGLNGNPSIRTFVLGIVAGSGSCPFDPNPPNVPDLNSVAAAGGTNQAYIVDPGASGATQQLLTALDNMRATLVVPCQYQIPKPSGGLADTSQVTVTVTRGSPATTETLVKVNDAQSCTNAGGWYFDNNSLPTSVNLCSSTCAPVQADQTSRVDITVGCIRG